jgi:hypothetical protein
MTEAVAAKRPINWREKWLACGIHFLATLLLAAVAASLIFFLWFPDPFQTMVGGTKLFELVITCDLVLGPLISLVIFDTRKARWKIVMDYCIVGVVQIAALVYGVLIVAGTRPVYVAFNADRLEVVTARDIEQSDLAAARDPAWAKLPWDGPKFVSIRIPPADQQDALFQAVQGKEEHQRPKFYAPYDAALADIRHHAKTVPALTAKFPESRPLFEAAMEEVDIPRERVRWLPVHHREGFWTALIDAENGRPVGYVPFDPYGD